MKYLFSNLIGVFVFDNQLNLVEERRFKSLKEHQDRTKTEDIFRKKYKDIKDIPESKLDEILGFFKDRKYFKDFYSLNLELTKRKIKSSVSEDLLIIQTISNIMELERTGNMLAKRLREWYSLHFPEFARRTENHEKFTELIIKKNKKELSKEIGLRESDSMGAELTKEDINEIRFLGKQVLGLYNLRKKHEAYLKGLMRKYCPNLLELAGVTIGGKLIELSKGLKRLALLPASTLQLLGAEKALFRHIKTGSKSPKYGVIINHPIIQKAEKKDKGKAARRLADKLSLCARLDYFKGEFKAKEYKKELEDKFR